MDSVRLSFFVGPQGVPLQEKDLRVLISPKHNRRPLPELDAHCIDETWKTKVAELGPKLFNGSKFRLDRIEADNGSGALLALGLTNYKESLGTTTCVEQYQSHQMGKVGESSSCCEPHLAMALGVECLLVTKDRKCVLFRRSRFVAAHAGWLCCPGGHPEPRNLCAVQFDSNEEAAQHFAEKVEQSAIVHELFDSAICEVVDEIGLERPVLQNEGLIAIVHSQLDLKPDLIFLVTTSLNADEVLAIHNKRLCAEAYESEEGSLLTIPLDEVEAATAGDCKITPPSVACLLLGQKVLQGSS